MHMYMPFDKVGAERCRRPPTPMQAYHLTRTSVAVHGATHMHRPHCRRTASTEERSTVPNSNFAPLLPHSSAALFVSPTPSAGAAAHGLHLVSLSPPATALPVASPVAPARFGEIQLQVAPPVSSILPYPSEAPVQEVVEPLAQAVCPRRVLHSDPSTGWSDWSDQAMVADSAAVATSQSRAANAAADPDVCIANADYHSASGMELPTKKLIERLQRQLDGFRCEDGRVGLFLGRFVMLGRHDRRQGGALFIVANKIVFAVTVMFGILACAHAPYTRDSAAECPGGASGAQNVVFKPRKQT